MPYLRVCALPFAAVRSASLPRASYQLIGAATISSFAWTAAVFLAETLAP